MSGVCHHWTLPPPNEKYSAPWNISVRSTRAASAPEPHGGRRYGWSSRGWHRSGHRHPDDIQVCVPRCVVGWRARQKESCICILPLYSPCRPLLLTIKHISRTCRRTLWRRQQSREGAPWLQELHCLVHQCHPRLGCTHFIGSPWKPPVKAPKT